ncbi:putative DNA binding domain-containing protein [Candidatus Halobeggiatoa sp. HSG11]|nr:putative DNA binding domain-containing protein [Candidatus Halobeggiatoa sp. HSG11]
MTTLANIRILVVEDDKDYLPRIIERLTKKGYQGIDTANNETEAKQKLEQNYYDVIVADMFLEGNTGGGFEVVEIIKQHKITSIVIILTANDSVKDCRRALKGYLCWDYISKTMEERSALSELHDSIQQALEYSNRWGNLQDKKWIQDNWDFLRTEYPNQHIAVLNHSVLATANSKVELEQQLCEKQLPLYLPVFQHIEITAITDIIQQGECDTIEFKQTYQYNPNPDSPKKKNDKLPFACLKTIAAFLNTNDGTLLIGVKDEGEIYGIEPDIEIATKRHDKDGFVQTITNAINDNIGPVFTEKYVLIYFETVEEKEICVVKVTKSEKLAFLKKEQKNLFFVRTNNSTRELDAREILEHCGFRE